MTNVRLAGRSLDVDLGPFVPRLTFLDGSKMRLQAQIGPANVDEIVAVGVKDVGPTLCLVSWTESSGNYIVQLQDHQNGVVHNCDRLSDGSLFDVEGTIRPA
jgi:hypothetical protein